MTVEDERLQAERAQFLVDVLDGVDDPTEHDADEQPPSWPGLAERYADGSLLLEVHVNCQRGIGGDGGDVETEQL